MNAQTSDTEQTGLLLLISRHWLLPVILAIFLVIVSFQNYLLFHTLAELFAIIVAFMAAVVVWQTYPLSHNHFLMYLGCGYIWVALLDMAHTLVYKGMSIIPIMVANPATQLWIGARYVEALMLLTAPLFLSRSINRSIATSLFGVVAVILFTLIMSGNFPDAFVEGEGLTTFKVVSEYVIIGLLIGALAHLWQQRLLLHRRFLVIITGSIILTICAELAFTFYVSVYGLSNLVGHIFKLFSFWLIYEAIVSNSLKRPVRVMSNDLRKEIEEHRRTELERKKHLHDVDERVKEIQCLHGVTEALRIRNTLDESFHDVIKIIPPGWHYPEYTKSRICFDDKEFFEAPFEPTEWKQTSDIIIGDKCRGAVEVYYTKEFPHLYEGPFLEEERHLIDSISKTLSEAIERKQAEVEKERLQRELQQSQKMESLGHMTGGIAHEFNNLLGVINGYAELAIDKYINKVDETLLGYMRNIMDAGNRAANLVTQMLAFSRKEQIDDVPLKLSHLIREDINMLRSTLPSTIEIETEIDPQLPSVLMNTTQLNQILMNLLINARDAMDGVGKLTVRLHLRHGLDTEDSVSHKSIKGDWIELSVSDTGSGIEPEIVENIFNPFFTTKEAGMGTGMGLSIIYRIMEDHGGHIMLDSELGKGTTFRMLFKPILDESDKTEYSNTEPVEILMGDGSEILVVDDEPMLAVHMSELLKHHGYEATYMSDSTKALELFKEDPERFSMLITDQTMPKMTGVELVEKLRLIRPELPVIICSGFSTKIDYKGAKELDIPYISKPVDANNLLRKIADLLGSNSGSDLTDNK